MAQILGQPCEFQVTHKLNVRSTKYRGPHRSRLEIPRQNNLRRTHVVDVVPVVRLGGEQRKVVAQLLLRAVLVGHRDAVRRGVPEIGVAVRGADQVVGVVEPLDLVPVALRA